MKENSNNIPDIFANVPYDCASCPIGFRVFKIHEIKAYSKRALEIEECLNNYIKGIHGDGNICVYVSFNKAFCGYEKDKSIRYLYQNRFKIVIEKIEFDITISANIPVGDSTFALPLDITDEEAITIIEKKINDITTNGEVLECEDIEA